MAVFGLPSVVLYAIPAVVFLVPAALVSAELASGWKGGVYNWVSEGISPAMGFAAVWCQFAQTTFYYPAVLAYIASTLSYAFAPGLAHSGVYTTVVIIVLFWASVLVVARGVRSTEKLASWGILIGTLIPGLLLVVLAVIYLAQGNHSAAPLDGHHVLPPWHGLTSIVLIVNGFFTYAGVEVNAVHVDDLANPAREFPRAILLAVIVILLVFIPPTLAISISVPSQNISLTAGVMQAFRSLLDHFSISFLEPVIAIGLVVASISGLLDWLAGPSTGLVQIGRERGYLPRYFQQMNANGVQLRILVAQGLVITVIGLLYALVPTVSRAYWIFAALATEVYLIMYVLMFVAAYQSRSVSRSILTSETFDNAQMNWTALAEIALAVMITQMDLFNRLLNTQPLTAPQFGLALAAAVLLLALWELGKLIARRREA